MFQNADELLAYVKNEGVEMIDCRFCDLIGVMQHFTVPAREFDKDTYEKGLAFDGSSTVSYTHLTLPTKRIV